MKLRTADPWMPGSEYGRSLQGFGVNLLVKDIARALVFQREVLGAEVVYSDPDIAVLRGPGQGAARGEWMLHADHTYDRHPLQPHAAGVSHRGAGVELRVHGCDPEAAEANARRLGFTVLAQAEDKPHGLREVHLLDADGYCWVPDISL
jgi:catechol 2,3-dioxygenase-like lactoylglutathione lyase family enzyme